MKTIFKRWKELKKSNFGQSFFSNIHLKLSPFTWSKKDSLLLLFLVFIGVTISTMPHLISGILSDNFFWVADNDELLYSSLVAKALFKQSYTLFDPASLKEVPVSYYPWLQFMPVVLICRLFTLSALSGLIIWRVWAGIAIPIMLFFLFRFIFQRRWLSFFATIFFMTDVGIMSNRPILRQINIIFDIILGRSAYLFQNKPQIFEHWRIITPGVSLVFLLFFILMMTNARSESSKKNIFLSGIGYGILFYVYFYFWTAISLTLALGVLIDRRKWRVYFHTGWLGLIIGVPNLISKLLYKGQFPKDWLWRIDTFLPIDHFSELLFHKTAAIILILIFWYFWKVRRDLIHFWIIGISSIFMANHQVISGLQVQNFHYSYVRGPVISLMIIIIIFHLFSNKSLLNKKWIKGILLTLLVVHFSFGFWLRSQEILYTSESFLFTQELKKFLKERPHFLKRNSVIAGDKLFVDYAVILQEQVPLDSYLVVLAPSVTDQEWNERIVLNHYLLGYDRKEFESLQKDYIFNKWVWGKWTREKQGRKKLLDVRLHLFDQIDQNLYQYINKYHVRYLALNSKERIPDNLKKLKWNRMKEVSHWTIWERKDL